MGTETGHRNTAGVDSTMPDMRTVRPEANSLPGADPREGVRVDQRGEHGSPFSPQCAELALIQAGALNFLQEEQSVAGQLLPKQRGPRDEEDDKRSVHDGTPKNTAGVP